MLEICPQLTHLFGALPPGVVGNTLISFDTETYLFEPGNMAPKIVCLTWSDDEYVDIVAGDDMETKALQLLESEEVLVGHNVAYDAAVLMANYPDLIDPIFTAYDGGRVHCTLVREKLLDIARGQHFIRKGRYSLAKIAERYKIIPKGSLDEDKTGPDAWRLRYSELDGIALEDWPEKAVNYAQSDAVITRAIHAAQEIRAERIGYDLPDQEMQVRAALALHLAGVWGVHTDPDHVEPLLTKTAKRMEELAKILIDEGLAHRKKHRKGPPTFHKKDKVMRERVRQWHLAHGLPVPLTGSGKPAADADTLDDIDGDPVIEIWQEYGGLQKARGTYIEKYVAGYDEPIHARFNVLVDTGRSSCAGPNWQNQVTPRVMPGVRECVIPRDGWLFVASDYDSQEMRTWAETCVRLLGWSKLADAYQDDPDFDPHTALACEQLITEESVGYEEGLKRKKIKGDIVKEMRQLAKVPNFGLPGGMGVRGLRKFAKGYGENISEAGAKDLIEAWRTQWPESLPYFDHIRALTGSFGGRGQLTQVISGRQRGRVTYTQAANSYFQGLAADCSKAALWEVSRRCYSVRASALYGCRVWNFVHDEIIIEAPEHRAHEAAVELAKVMVEEMSKFTEHVPVRASAAIMRRWYKDAEAVYDESGRMIPWEPKQ